MKFNTFLETVLKPALESADCKEEWLISSLLIHMGLLKVLEYQPNKIFLNFTTVLEFNIEGLLVTYSVIARVI